MNDRLILSRRTLLGAGLVGAIGIVGAACSSTPLGSPARTSSHTAVTLPAHPLSSLCCAHQP